MSLISCTVVWRYVVNWGLLLQWVTKRRSTVGSFIIDSLLFDRQAVATLIVQVACQPTPHPLHHGMHSLAVLHNVGCVVFVPTQQQTQATRRASTSGLWLVSSLLTACQACTHLTFFYQTQQCSISGALASTGPLSVLFAARIVRLPWCQDDIAVSAVDPCTHV